MGPGTMGPGTRDHGTRDHGTKKQRFSLQKQAFLYTGFSPAARRQPGGIRRDAQLGPGGYLLNENPSLSALGKNTFFICLPVFLDFFTRRDLFKQVRNETTRKTC